MLLGCMLAAPSVTSAQGLPTPTYGWNLGNTLEAPTGEGTWAPPANQTLINNVAAAGFNTVRIPCAWNSHANTRTLQIDPNWLARVKQVVDYCYANNLYVVLNSHWDNGWFDSNGFRRYDSKLNAKVQSYWTQIAKYFANYDSHLLFACANEPSVDSSAGPSRTAVLLQYYQTFVTAVRASGGNNPSRWLVIQGPNTNIQNTYDWMNSLPTDSATGRLMVEVHYYDPYNYCMMDADASWGNMAYFWGQSYHSATMPIRNPTWGEESWLQQQFQLMYTKFSSKGITVLLGEFGAIRRTAYTDLTGTELTRHFASRTFYDQTVVSTANQLGLKPCYWDDSGTNNNSFGLYDRTTNALVDVDSARALTGGSALPPP